MGQNLVKVDTKAIEKLRAQQMEEELAVIDLTFARQHALDISRRREQFHWEVLAAGTLTAVLVGAGSVLRRKDFVIPVVPLIMGVGYRYDTAYGEQLETIRDNAEKMLRENPDRYRRIGGPITLQEIDRLRSKMYGIS